MANEFPEATARVEEEFNGPGSAGHDLAMSQDGDSDRFRITWHGFHYGYRVSIPNYEGGEVVKAEAHDALAKVTLEWIEKFKELDHRIFHPSETRDFRDCSEETCREATRLAVRLRAALHPQPQEGK